MKLKTTIVFTVVALLLSSCASMKIDEANETVYLGSIESGNEVVGALDAYYLENGNYPEILSQLIPEFIREIPETGEGFTPLSYSRTEDSKEFKLSFNSKSESLSLLWKTSYTEFAYFSGEIFYTDYAIHFSKDGWIYFTYSS